MRVQLDSNRIPKYSEVLADLLRERHSCRGFLPYPVSRTTIETILGIAQRTASWCNSQPWQISIASGEALLRLREQLLQHVRSNAPQPDFPWPSGYHGVYKERRRECGLQLYESVGVAAGDRQAGEQQISGFSVRLMSPLSARIASWVPTARSIVEPTLPTSRLLHIRLE